MTPTEHPGDSEVRRQLRDLLGLSVDEQQTLRVTVDRFAATLSEGHAAEPGPPVGDRLGRFRMLRELGHGGMGAVYQVYDEDLGRAMAAKVVLGQANRMALEKFVLEAQVTGRLEHPNIVPVHELGQSADGQPYYTMKQVQGRTLREVLAAEQQSSLVALLGIFLKVCDALAFAHAEGVIHRDLKPDNVMVGAFGEVLVMDWGLAKVLSIGDAATQDGTEAPAFAAGLTLMGQVMGTPAYMAPEQAAGRIDELDARSDVYALGAMLYEILTGELPYHAETIEELLAQVQEGRFPPPREAAPSREIPWELEAVVLRAMARERSERYGSAAELKADLEAFLEGRVVGAARYGVVAALRKWAATHKHLVRGVAAVLVTAALFAGYLVRERTRRDEARRAALAKARREAVEVDPQRLVKETLAAVEAAPVDPAQRRQPTPAEKRRYTRLLGELQRQAGRWSGVLRLSPADPEASKGLHATLIAMGRLAEISEDYTLALFAFEQASTLGVDDAAARKLYAGVGQAAVARSRMRQQRVVELLTAARAGKLERDDNFRAAVIEIASYRERPIVDLLVQRLDRWSRDLRKVTRKELLSVRVPTTDERRAGGATLVGLAAAVERWMARQATVPGPGLEPAQRKLIEQALLRLALRRRGKQDVNTKQQAVSWHALLASTQERQVLSRNERSGGTTVALICGALGQMGETEGPIEALAGYLWSEWDQLRAVHAGLALVRLARITPRAERALFELLEEPATTWPGAVRPRWGVNSIYWNRMREALGRAGPRSRRPVQPAVTAEELRARGRRRLEAWDLKGAREDLDRAVERDPGDAENWFVRGTVKLSARQHAEALADFERAIRIAPRHRDAHINQGLCLQRLGRLDAALSALSQALAIDPDSWLARLNRATVLSALGRMEQALAEYDRLLSADPRLVPALINRGRLYKELRRYKEALADLTRAVRLSPDEAKGWLNLGNVQFHLGDQGAAERSLTRAIALNASEYDAYSTRAQVRAQRGNRGGALADLAAARRLAPSHLPTQRAVAMVYVRLGEPERALALARQAVKQAPQDGDAHGVQGWALQVLKRHTEAIRAFDQAVRLLPRSAQWFDLRGLSRRKTGDLKGAVADAGKALALEPGRHQALVHRATALEQAGNLQAALADLDAAARLVPREAAIYINRGGLLRKLGRPDRALADYDKAIALDPKMPLAYTHRGSLVEAQGKREAAIEDYTRAIRLAPRFALAYYNRGNAHLASRRYQQAIADFDRALQIDPRMTMAWMNLGNAHANAGRLAQGIAAYRKGLELAPGDWRLWANLGFTLWRSGQRAEARQALDKAARVAPAEGKQQIEAIKQRLGIK